MKLTMKFCHDAVINMIALHHAERKIFLQLGFSDDSQLVSG